MRKSAAWPPFGAKMRLSAAADARPSMMENADALARNALREIVMSLDPFLRNDAYIIAVSPRACNPGFSPFAPPAPLSPEGRARAPCLRSKGALALATRPRSAAMLDLRLTTSDLRGRHHDLRLAPVACRHVACRSRMSYVARRTSKATTRPPPALFVRIPHRTHRLTEVAAVVALAEGARIEVEAPRIVREVRIRRRGPGVAVRAGIVEARAATVAGSRKEDAPICISARARNEPPVDAVGCDPRGGAIALNFYLSDWGDNVVRAPLTNPSEVTVVPDKAHYRVGETPRLTVKDRKSVV